MNTKKRLQNKILPVFGGEYSCGLKTGEGLIKKNTHPVGLVIFLCGNEHLEERRYMHEDI